MRPFWYHVHETSRRVRQILDANRFDVVFVQKAIMSTPLRGLLGMVRRRSKRLVYDIDDAVHLASPHSLRPVWSVFEDKRQIVKLMRAADLVLTGNGWLTEEARNAGANAVEFPTVVDTDRWVPAARTNGVYRIGWVGSPSTAVCLEPAAEALAKVEHAEIRLVGAVQNGTRPYQAEFAPWSLETEVSEIQGFSVGIMPMPRGDWMLGKCALKALQYMACGAPCVATPFGAVKDIIRHNQNGLFADTTTEWLDAFERLRDPRVRAELGAAGRQTVVERFSLAGAAPKLARALESVA